MILKVDTAIVGTGFGGLGAAIQLQKAGFYDFVLLERAAEIGGVWRDNTYPGCACDVESPLYSFSFAPNPRWSRLFAGQAEIWDYLKACVERFALGPRIWLNHELQDAVWNETEKRWQLKTSGGPLTARVLIAGMGALSEPALPALPGLSRFAGKVFHSARWNHAHDLGGRRVAVVGTGASSIQFVPKIQPQVAKLHLFQRAAPWVLPRSDRLLTEAEKQRCAKLPLYQRLWRFKIFITKELYGFPFRHPRLMKKAQAMAVRHMQSAIKDPTLREKLTPAYAMGCKRILLSNDFYPAVAQPNVELVTARIKQIKERSLVTDDGIERFIDTIILGTGFQVTNLPSARLIWGKNGRCLQEAAGASPKAHLGTTFPGFPNFFMLQGPNTGLGHSSVVMMIEYQISHVIKALTYMRHKNMAALEPKPEAMARSVAEIDRKMRRTVWTTGGCRSWYLDATGRNSTLWPASVPAFGRRVGRFHPDDYKAYRIDEGAMS
jgi:cation diffusion facilitator CzcD-associated flavoprotein CzcO